MAIVSTGQIYLSDTSDGISLQLSPPSISIPANSGGTIVAGTYTSTLSIYIGTTNDSTNWAYSVALGTGVTGSIGAATGILSVTALSQDASYVDITAKKFAYPDQTIRCVVVKVRAGADGAASTVAGPTGSTGQSNHRVYIKTANSATQPGTPDNTTSGGVPTTSGGVAAAWSATPVTVTGVQAQWQSDGVTPAGSTTTTWGTPYLSYFKVGSLSAISADLGTITAGSISGTSLTIGTSPAVAGTTMTGTGASITTAGNFALGNSTTNISFNGTTMTLNGNVVASGNIQTGAVGTGALSTNAVTDSNSGEYNFPFADRAAATFTRAITIPTSIYFFIVWVDPGTYPSEFTYYDNNAGGYVTKTSYLAPNYDVTFNSVVKIPTAGAGYYAAAPTQFIILNPTEGTFNVVITRRTMPDAGAVSATGWTSPSIKYLLLKK